ncbi:MAG: MBL fold metallo-hydrolase [Acidobacteriota bacterium]|jgi:glyoxylase-like metal-dependent hydrolase (beta-lactamase superfamily II)/8-oxo-dGTP pyrophosphatase MutT (NUDIX family)
MSDGNLYETVVGRGGFEPPPAKVRASSAVIPWRRRTDGELEVFWMRRDPAMRFMGGWHAFPGGTVSRHDEALEEAGWIDGRPAGLESDRVSGAMPEALTAGLGALPPDAVDGLVAATLRELFEETGILPLSEGSRAFPAERLSGARAAVEGKETAFGELLAGSGGEDGIRLDASRLVFAGRWLTPAFAPVRFDNRFFLLEHRPGDGEPIAGGEAIEAGWVRPADALDAWRGGRITAAPPIVHVLKTLASRAGNAGPEAVLERLREPSEVNLGPHRAIELRPGVLLFPLPTPTLPPAAHTNCYVLGTHEAVLVDPGTPWEEEIDRLAAALDELPARLGRRIGAIWLTHHHPDHVGAVARLRDRLGVPVAAHRLTAERLRGRGIAVDRELADGERIELAGPEGEAPVRVRTLHTPGHASGHLCFLEERLGSLLAGDTVSAVSTIVVDPPEGDMDAYIRSLERLIEEEPKMLFPGHGPAILAVESTLRELIDHRLWRERKILDAWRAGLRNPDEMLPEVYDDAPRQAWPLAARQILAHLRRLQRAGTIEPDPRHGGSGRVG